MSPFNSTCWYQPEKSSSFATSMPIRAAPSIFFFLPAFRVGALAWGFLIGNSLEAFTFSSVVSGFPVFCSEDSGLFTEDFLEWELMVGILGPNLPLDFR